MGGPSVEELFSRYGFQVFELCGAAPLHIAGRSPDGLYVELYARGRVIAIEVGPHAQAETLDGDYEASWLTPQEALVWVLRAWGATLR